MSERRIILADGPRLLRDMLRQIIDKTDGLQIIGEAENPTDLDRMLAESNVQWVVTCPTAGEDAPAWIEGSVCNHPVVRFLSVAIDGHQIKIKWLEPREKTLNVLSLPDLIAILQERSPLTNKGDIFA